MTTEDEPLFPGEVPPRPESDASDLPLRERIERLVNDQLYGILCTQGEAQPYGSIIAFAFSEDLRSAVFATATATRKYRLLSEQDHVALVVDNRSRNPDDMMKIEAITVTGRAIQLNPGEEQRRCAGLLINRHPYLKAFVESESCALFRIEVYRFFHVMRFQEVRQWVPTSP